MFSISISYDKNKLSNHGLCEEIDYINEEFIDADLSDIAAQLIAHISETVIINKFDKYIDFKYIACLKQPCSEYIDHFFDTIEYLPRLLEKLYSNYYDEFFDSFYEDITLKFVKEKTNLRVTCHEFYSDKKLGEEEIISIKEFKSMLLDLFNSFIDITKIVCPLTYQYPALQEWIEITKGKFD